MKGAIRYPGTDQTRPNPRGGWWHRCKCASMGNPNLQCGNDIALDPEQWRCNTHMRRGATHRLSDYLGGMLVDR